MILHYPDARTAIAESVDKARTACVPRENLTLSRILGGKFKIFTDASDISQTPELACDGIADVWMLELFCDMVAKGSCVADVGAAFGYHSLVLCELVGPAGRLFAFEPHPRIYPVLKRNLEKNGFSRRARPYPNALGAEEGDGELLLHKWRFNSATLAQRAKASFGSEHIAAVHVSRMDELLSESGAAPDFYLLSVVGYEPEVWAGMRGLLNAKRTISALMEFTPRWYADAAGFAAQILEDGFTVHRVSEDGRAEPLHDTKQFTTQFRSWLKLTR